MTIKALFLHNKSLSPEVFCFLRGGAREGLFCMPVAVMTTCDVGTAIIAGGLGAPDVVVMATAAVFFFVFFLGDSMGTRLSSYSFLFTVLLI